MQEKPCAQSPHPFTIVIFRHPASLGSQSMRRFADALRVEFRSRGYDVSEWCPGNTFYTFFAQTKLAKWAGYVDQYVVFPMYVKKLLARRRLDTLYVFSDQALGPWVPLVVSRPHIVHCHDLLALRSALGEFPENPTKLFGRVYQWYICEGFKKARSFIAVSRKSCDDLLRFVSADTASCEVVYNGLNPAYTKVFRPTAEAALQAAGMQVGAGFLLHVGGGQWYKNREGTLRLYLKYAAATNDPLPLWMVGPAPNEKLQRLLSTAPLNARVTFYQNVGDETLASAYSVARVFLFPSLAEGFGWPVAEALACGCPVITTDEAPMTEVGGDAAHYLDPMTRESVNTWVEAGAMLLNKVLAMPETERAERALRGMQWVKRFDSKKTIDGYEKLYQLAFANASRSSETR